MYRGWFNVTRVFCLKYMDTKLPKRTCTLIATEEQKLNTRTRCVGCLCTTTRKL